MDDQIEYYEEQVDGGMLRLPATRWRNDGATACAMELLVDGPRENPRWQKNMPTTPQNPCLFPAKWFRMTLKRGEEALIPSYLDPGVQQLACLHPACRQRPLAGCADPTHDKQIVGGAGPNLTRISPRIAPTTPQLSRSLDPALPSIAPQTIDDRLMMRARRGVQ